MNHKIGLWIIFVQLSLRKYVKKTKTKTTWVSIFYFTDELSEKQKKETTDNPKEEFRLEDRFPTLIRTKSENETKRKILQENRFKSLPYDYEAYSLSKQSEMLSYQPYHNNYDAIPQMADFYTQGAMRRNLQLLQRFNVSWIETILILATWSVEYSTEHNVRVYYPRNNKRYSQLTILNWMRIVQNNCCAEE